MGLLHDGKWIVPLNNNKRAINLVLNVANSSFLQFYLLPAVISLISIETFWF